MSLIAGFFGVNDAADAQSDAIKQASAAQSAAADKAIAEQRHEYKRSRQDLLPWLTTGGSALSSLAQLYGLDRMVGGQTVQGNGQRNYGNFYKSPDYQFRFNEGLKGVNASAAARGMLDSGATRKAEIDYAGNLASGEFGNYVSRLMGLAGVGQQAGTTIGGFGQNTANNISNITTNQGDNLASSYLASGNVEANRVGQLWGMGGQAPNSLFGSLGSGGGFGGGGFNPLMFLGG